MDFRVGDCLITLAYGKGLLTKGIQYYQRYFLRHPDPGWRSTHTEIVVEVGETSIKTFSQTAPIAKYVTRNKALLQNDLLGDTPKHALFRFYDYSNVVTDNFIEAMLNWCQEKTYEKKGWQDYWFAVYDLGQLIMYPVNWVARLFGYTKHIAWLEKSGANVCSDAVATAYRKGLVADGKQEDYIFSGLPSSEVAPSHFWTVESRMFRNK